MEAVLKTQAELLEEDRGLVEECRQGIRQSFNRLVLKYQNKIFSIAYRMLKNADDAKDVTQDVFLAVYRSIDKFRGDSRLSTWLYRIVVNLCINRLKSSTFRYAGELEDYKLKNTNGDIMPENPDEALSRKNLNLVLEKEIGKLSAESRVMVIMRDVEGLSYEEIAKVLELPEGTVKSRLHRARIDLKERLKKLL